jgi:hypothetical protein
MVLPETYLQEVDQLEALKLEWFEAYAKPDAADAAWEAERAKVVAEHTRGGLTLLTDAVLEQHEQKWRANRDAEGRAQAVVHDAKRSVIASELADAISRAETLRSRAHTEPMGSSNFLLASILDELQVARVRDEFIGLTRMQLVDVVERWKDDEHNPQVRLFEAAVQAGTLQQLGVRDDPETDALAIPRLERLVSTRRQARVPNTLLEAQARLAKRSLAYEHAVEHLRSGRGIAVRPHLTRMRVV